MTFPALTQLVQSRILLVFEKTLSNRCVSYFHQLTVLLALVAFTSLSHFPRFSSLYQYNTPTTYSQEEAHTA